MVLPGDLVRALAWLRQRLDQPVRLDALAEVAGVRPRTLESHFRVPRRHAAGLGAADPHTQCPAHAARVRRPGVTGAALANGFNQLGRFAADTDGVRRAAIGNPAARPRRRARARRRSAAADLARLVGRSPSRPATATCAGGTRPGPVARARLASPRRWLPGAGASAPPSISARRRTWIAPARASSPRRPKCSHPTTLWRDPGAAARSCWCTRSKRRTA